jgi:hypothetical protein
MEAMERSPVMAISVSQAANDFQLKVQVKSFASFDDRAAGNVFGLHHSMAAIIMSGNINWTLSHAIDQLSCIALTRGAPRANGAGDKRRKHPLDDVQTLQASFLAQTAA